MVIIWDYPKAALSNTGSTLPKSWLKTVIPAPKTDIPEGVTVTWKVQNKLNMSNGKVGKDGALNLANITWKDAMCGMIMVTATAGEGDEAVSVSVPVFSILQHQ